MKTVNCITVSQAFGEYLSIYQDNQTCEAMKSDIADLYSLVTNILNGVVPKLEMDQTIKLLNTINNHKFLVETLHEEAIKES